MPFEILVFVRVSTETHLDVVLQDFMFEFDVAHQTSVLRSFECAMRLCSSEPWKTWEYFTRLTQSR